MKTVDAVVIVTYWGALAATSAVALAKAARKPHSKMPITQVSGLPRKWQRWLTGEGRGAKRG